MGPKSWVLGPGAPNRAKGMGPKIYLHKVDLFRGSQPRKSRGTQLLPAYIDVINPPEWSEDPQLTCRGPGTQNESWVPGPNHDSPNRAKVVGPKFYLHKINLFRILLS